MKAYKIAVPESGWYDEVLIDRQEIHELIQEKAFELGYDKYDNKSIRILYDNKYYALFMDGSHGPCNGVIINMNRISWQDFLKLTTEDVNDGTPINLAKNTVENIQAISTTNNYEKALQESIKLMCNNARDAGYAKGLLSGFLLCFDENMNIRDIEMLRLCINNADEFIKQAGNK